MDLRTMLIAGAVGGLVAFGGGMQFGKSLEKGACEKRVAAVEKAAGELIDKKDDEIEKLGIEAAFAKAEVVKVNAVILKQFEDQKALLLADQAAREDASRKADERAAGAAKEARVTAARFQAALEAIKRDPDQCTNAPLSPDLKRVLDDILKGSP